MIRGARDDDMDGLAEVVRDAEPWWVISPHGLRHRIATAPLRAQRRDWVAEVDGRVAGWAACSLEPDTVRRDVAWLRVTVRPRWRRRGIGAELYSAAAAHSDDVGAGRVLSSGGDDEGSRRFAAARGFVHASTQRFSRVRPQDVDPEELPRLHAARRAEGFDVAPFAAFEDRPELVYAVDAEAVLDEPVDEPVEPLRLEEWLAMAWAHPDVTREGSFVVVHEDRPVAFTELFVDEGGARAGNGFTATLRAYRGRGLARLAKLASIAWAAENGIASIVTGNDETNAPMLAVNTRLGYRPFATKLSWARDVT
jgi:GNAT superfamily N-acetyltransferase